MGRAAGPDGELVPIADSAAKASEAAAGDAARGARQAGGEGGGTQSCAGATAAGSGHNASAGAGLLEGGGGDEGAAGGEGEDEAFDGEAVNARSGMINKDYELWQACENGDTHLVREWLKAKASPNAAHPGVFKWTAMHLAAINDQAPTLELLHEHGAELDLRDASGRTPIRLARKHLKLEAVAALEAMMGYHSGEGSDTDVEVGDDLPYHLRDQLGLDATDAADLPADYQHSFFKELREKLASNATAVGSSAWKIDTNSSERLERERRQQANREASRRRREAACELDEPEKCDADGFTASQRKHLNRLIHASRVNQETGRPMASILEDRNLEPPEYALPPRKRASEEGPDHSEEAEDGAPPVRMPWE